MRVAAVCALDENYWEMTLEVVRQAESEILLELEVAEGVVVELLVAVVVESPEGIDFAGDVLVELEGKDILHFGFAILVGGEVVEAATPREVLHDGDTGVELDFGTEVLLEVLIAHVIGGVDGFFLVVDVAHFVGKGEQS